MNRNIIAAALLMIACWTTVAVAQHTENKADQTLRSTGRVNPSSLGMEIDIPLIGYPGRGISLPIGLNYSSKVWRLEVGEKPDPCPPSLPACGPYVRPMYGELSAAGWTTTLQQPYVEYTGEDNFYNSDGTPFGFDYTANNGSTYHIKRVSVHLFDGSSHELRASDSAVTSSQSNPISWDGWYYAVDGSGIRYYENAASGTYKIYLTDGSFYTLASSQDAIASGYPSGGLAKSARKAVSYQDKTGLNTITYIAASGSHPNGAWQDTLGRIIDIPLGLEAPANAGVQDYFLPGMGSTPLNYKLHWKKLQGATAADSALTNFSDQLQYPGQYYLNSNNVYQSYNADYTLFDSGNAGGTNNFYHVGFSTNTQYFNPIVLAAIELPNGQKYEFGYNIYGEIDTIKYPTGGAEKFTYSQVEPLSKTNQVVRQTNRGVTTRKIYETAPTSPGDTPTAVWSYSNDVQDNTNNGQLFYRVTTTAPDSSKTERIMHRNNQFPSPVWGFDDLLAGMPIEERSFSTTGVLLSRTLSSWTTSTNRFARKTADETIIYDASGSGTGLSTKTTLQYDGDLSQIDAPLNVNRTVKYAYVPVSDGAISIGSAPVGSPTASTTLTAASVTETDFLYTSSDPNLSTLKTNCTNLNMLNLPIASRVMNGSTVVSQTKIAYDEANYSQSGRCNPTSVSAWLDTTNAYLTTRTSYDIYGNVTATTDAKGNVTTTTYDGTYHAYPVSVTTPIPDPTGTRGSSAAFTTSMMYNAATGLPISSTDANGQTTTMEYNDALLRLTKVTAPNGHQTITQFGVPTAGQLPANQRFVKVKTQIDANTWKEGYTWFDGLARTVKTQSVNSSGDVFALTCYDAMGRVSKISNPFRSTSNPGCSSTSLEWTSTIYDTAGRPWKVTTPDSAFVETNYSLATSGNNIGTVTTVKDQALRERRSITNALGQLIRVDEPFENKDQNGNVTSITLGTISAPAQPTYYEYDFLSNLTKVKQGGTESSPTQQRTFAYDSLSRLKSANNPESGLIQYSYDNNGNLTQKIDARIIQTNYTYDALNRVITRDYSDSTFDVMYTYDNLSNAKGKRIKVMNGTMSNNAISNPFSITDYQQFDQMGRVTQSQQTTDGASYPQMTYTYNLSGALVEQKYPSGRVVKNVLDADGDLSIVQSKKNQTAGFWNYADNFTYTAAGAVSSMQLGNGRWESTQFNSRLQPTQIALGAVQNGTDKLKLIFTYNTWTNGNPNTDNNGNVLTQKIEVQTVGATPGFTATQVYTYDALNRLKSAEETIPSQTGWKQTFDYDRFGNRTFNEANTTTDPLNFPKACSGAMCPADKKKFNPQAQISDNRFSSTDGYIYDAAGNTTRNAENRKFTYDAENKQTKVETVDSNGTVTGTLGEYFYDGDGKRIKKIVPGTGETTVFIYDAAGKLVAENSTLPSPTQTVSYLTNDHLGSPRINTDANGNVTARHDYQPFGEEIQRVSYGVDANRKQFTGYERDKETDLDFAQARMYINKLGRFSSPDPLLGSGKVESAQTWNRFIYVLNNPLNFSDPLGLYECRGTGEECTQFGYALSEAKYRLSKMKQGSKEYDALKSAIAVYGCNAANPLCGDKGKNGVSIFFQTSKPGYKALGITGTAGTIGTKTTANPNGQDIRITFSRQVMASDRSLRSSVVVHEGSHAFDGSEWVAHNFSDSWNPTDYQSERDAYTVQSYFEEKAYVKVGLSYDSKTEKDSDGNPIKYYTYNSSWKDVDDERLKNINGILKNLPTPTTPEAQGAKSFEKDSAWSNKKEFLSLK